MVVGTLVARGRNGVRLVAIPGGDLIVEEEVIGRGREAGGMRFRRACVGSERRTGDRGGREYRVRGKRR